MIACCANGSSRRFSSSYTCIFFFSGKGTSVVSPHLGFPPQPRSKSAHRSKNTKRRRRRSQRHRHFFFWGGGYGHVEKEEDITCDTLAYIFRIEAKKSYRALNTVVVEYRTSLIRRWIYQPDNSWRCTVYTQKPPPPPNWPIRLRVRFLSWILGRIRTCQHVEYLKRKM